APTLWPVLAFALGALFSPAAAVALAIWVFPADLGWERAPAIAAAMLCVGAASGVVDRGALRPRATLGRLLAALPLGVAGIVASRAATLQRSPTDALALTVLDGVAAVAIVAGATLRVRLGPVARAALVTGGILLMTPRVEGVGLGAALTVGGVAIGAATALGLFRRRPLATRTERA
ncbi:MAG: hypothetical protein NZ518_08170, partial [Dehalococcoidia bacterium]|nr:hypothetical protein [Dehalococcoidia bacterium]